jgi:hypothetical protein
MYAEDRREEQLKQKWCCRSYSTNGYYEEPGEVKLFLIVSKSLILI